MLRYIFMDCNPYIVDIDQIYSNVWKSFFETNKDESISIKLNEMISEKNFEFIEKESIWINKLGQEQYDLIKSEIVVIFKNELKKYIKSIELSEVMKKFFLDAKENNTNIVIVSSNPFLSEIAKLYDLPNNVKVELINQNYYLTTKSLVDYVSEFNLTYEQIACITQVDNTLDDMVENNIFCVTINENKDYLKGKGLVLSSIDDLDYSNISYNFFTNLDKNEEENI